MEFHEALSARLPAPRDDEPRGLRQDIVDELADHLACSANRELLRGVDPATARARVLERFGDPAAVARRLWLDAMMGKIMAQRVVIATSVLMTAISLALVGLLVQQSVQAQRMAALQAADARAREQEMLKQLRDMSDAIRHPRSPDWNPVRVKLTEESADGPPIAGAWIALNRLHELPANTTQKESDKKGVVDFGLVSPGDYRFEINRRWPDGQMSASGELNVQPGSDVTKSIVCPRTPPMLTGVRVRWKWPADLEKEPLQLYASFSFRDRELESGIHWTVTKLVLGERNQRKEGPGRPVWHTPRHSVLCGPSTRISEFLNFRVPFFWTLEPDDPATHKDDASKFGWNEWADVVDENIREVRDATATIEMEMGHYVLSDLVVLRPSPARDFGSGHRCYELLAVTNASNYPQPIIRTSGPRSLEQITDAEYERQQLSRLLVDSPQEYWLKLNSDFEARSGQPNEWTIPIPDELAQAVRKALKADKAPKAKPAEKSAAVKGTG